MDEIRALVDRNLVIDAVNALFVSTDNRDWRAVEDCFAADVLFDMTSVTGGEPVRMTPPLKYIDGNRDLEGSR